MIDSFANGRPFQSDALYLVSVNNYILGNEGCSLICRMSGCSHVQEISGLPEQQQEKLIREARKAAVSIRQLSRLTGISKTKIERIAKKTD